MVMRMSLRSGEIVTCGARRKTPGSPGPDNTNAGVPDRLRAFRANTCRYRYTRSANPAWSASFRQAGRFPRKPCYRRNGSPGCARPSLRTRRSYAHAIARQRRHGGGHFDAVLALGQVLLLEFVFRALEHGASKMRPSAKPTWPSDLMMALESNSRMPLKFTDAMVGRSCTTTTTTLLSVWICTSEKSPCRTGGESPRWLLHR